MVKEKSILVLTLERRDLCESLLSESLFSVKEVLVLAK